MDKNYYKYTDYHLEPGGLLKLDSIIDFIRKKYKDKKLTILDIGCGSGNIALPLAYLGYQVTAIDESQEAVLELQKKFFVKLGFKTQLNTIIVSFENFYPTKKYDVIIMSEFLEHLNDPEKALLKAKNLLTEDGYVIVTVPNGRSAEELLRRFLLSNKALVKIKKTMKRKFVKSEIQTPAQSPHLYFWNYRQIEKLINKASLKIEQALVYASFGKEFFYIIGRIFIKRGNLIFKILNKTDNFLASHIPVRFGSSWLMVLKKDD